MRAINWLTNACDRIGWSRRNEGDHSRLRRRARRLFLEPLESRQLLAADFGDAPDTGPGTGASNFNTLATDNGPSHTIVAGLKIGAAIDGDSGTLQNSAAHADDVDQALPE